MWTGDESIIYLYEAPQCMICISVCVYIYIYIYTQIYIYTCKLNIWVLLHVLQYAYEIVMHATNSINPN